MPQDHNGSMPSPPLLFLLILLAAVSVSLDRIGDSGCQVPQRDKQHRLHRAKREETVWPIATVLFWFLVSRSHVAPIKKRQQVS